MTTAQINRANDAAIDDALGLFQGVMAYDIEVAVETELTGPQMDHLIREVHALELARATLTHLTDETMIITGNDAFTHASAVKEWTQYGRRVGYKWKSYFAKDPMVSPWSGEGEVDSLPNDDGTTIKLTYKWRKDPLLGKWGARKFAVRGWESKMIYDDVPLQSWEDRERLLLKLFTDLAQSQEFVDGSLNGVQYPSVLPIQVRNVPIGGGQRAYVIFSTSDVAVSLLTTSTGVDIMGRFNAALMTIDEYKALLTNVDDTVGSQVTDGTEAEREGRMMVIWAATDQMTEQSLQSFFDEVEGPARGTVALIELKRAYLPPNKAYVMVTQAAVEGCDEATRDALMMDLIRCEPQAQSKYNSQAITFKRSKSRIQRAAEKATWANVTRVRDSALSQQQGVQQQSSMMTQMQLNQVISAFKNACLHDQAYQQQMAAALIHQMKAEFAAMAKEVGVQVVASLAQWRVDTAVELDRQFELNLDHGLVAACDRTGMIVTTSPVMQQQQPAANVTMMQQQQPTQVMAAEQQRQQQRMADRTQQQFNVHSSSRDQPLSYGSPAPMTPAYASPVTPASAVNPAMAAMLQQAMAGSGGHFIQ